MGEAVRVLPPGATVCGWCEGFEARADLLEKALRRIAGFLHAQYCPANKGAKCLCTVGVAERALAALVPSVIGSSEDD